MPAQPDLVLLHGALGAAGQLDPLADSLRQRFQIHQMDFEGHGDSTSRGRPFRISHFVENVIGFLDREGIGQARLFGYSMGGYVALSLAAHQPERIERIATLGTKFRWDTQTAAREASRLDPATIRAKVPRFAEALEARHAKAGGWETVLAHTVDFLRDLGDHPPLTDDVLGRIRQPVLIIVGDRDNTVNIDESAAIAAALSAGSTTVLANTPHPIEQIDVAQLAPILTGFFG